MNSLKSRFALMLLLSAVGYAMSFGSQLVIAYHFGTSQAMDVYWGALALVNLLTFYMAPLKEALVPAVHRAHKTGDAEAGKVLSAGLSVLLLLTVGSALVLLMSSLGFARWLAGDGAAGDILRLAPWLVPYLCAFVLAETLNTTLISFNQVVRQSWVRNGAALVLLVSIAMTGASLGVGGLFLAQIFSMGTLILASGWALRHLRLRLVTRAWPVLRDSGMLPLFGSLLLAYLFSQLYVLAERSAMIHLGTGVASGFQYSTALVNVLVSLVAYPLANLLWSQFLIHAADGDAVQARALAVRACGLLFYVLMVVCAFVWVNAQEIVVILFGRGAFDAASVQLTSTALRATIFTAIPIGVMSVLGRLLMSHSGAHKQLWIGLATTAAGLVVIGCAVLAQSERLVQWHWMVANCAGMLVSLCIFVSGARLGWASMLAAARWLVTAGVVALLAAWLVPGFSLGDSKAGMAAALVAQGALYLVLVFGLTWAFRLTPLLRQMLREMR